MKINWGSLPDIPPATGQTEQKGLAGALAGVSSEMLIVAGGSNFPDSLPWQGGTKTYYNNIFFFNLNEKEAAWHVAGEKLPVPLAYSACVSVNGELICIGGENLNGPLSGVLKLKIDRGEVQISTLTDFPVAVSNSGAVKIGSLVYVAGGSGTEGNLSSFYSADVSKDMPEWEKLPDLPRPVSNAVVVSQWDGNEDCIYVVGGRSKDAELSTFFSSVWKYSPSKKSWESAGEISNAQKEPVTLAAGTGVAVGKNHILLFGGDNGQLYNKTEEFINAATAAGTPEEKEAVNKQKIKHLEGHPGFSRQVFWYNTLTGECEEEGELSFPAQVTTLAVKFNNRIYIPNGEIRPGVRTPKVNVADLSGDNLE
ncbi:MAG: hypothetical protein ACK5HT_18110 [Draconibacterium sp.]